MSVKNNKNCVKKQLILKNNNSFNSRKQHYIQTSVLENNEIDFKEGNKYKKTSNLQNLEWYFVVLLILLFNTDIPKGS